MIDKTKELLQYLMDNHIIDMSCVRTYKEMTNREKMLKKHPYKIWEATDGNWKTYLPDKNKKRRLIKKKSLKDLENMVISYWEEQEENPTIQEVFEEWNNRRLNLKKISPATHYRNIQIYNRHFKEFGKQKIKEISPEDLADFLEEQVPQHDLSAKSFSNLKTVVRGMYKRAKRRKLVSFSTEDIFEELDTSESEFKKRIKEDYEEVFNEEEMNKMLEYLMNHLDCKNMGILLMFITGIRVGELVALKHSDFSGNTFKIRRTETRIMSGNQKSTYDVKEFPKSSAGVRIVVIPNDFVWLAHKLKQTNPFSEYIFINDSGGRMTTNCIRSRQRLLCKKLGIYAKSPHKIRKTYGTILLDNHVDNKLIEEMMGHADILCTERHYHRNRRSIDKKAEILSCIPDFQLKATKK